MIIFSLKEETGAQFILGILKRWVYESIDHDTYTGKIGYLCAKVTCYILSVFQVIQSLIVICNNMSQILCVFGGSKCLMSSELILETLAVLES